MGLRNKMELRNGRKRFRRSWDYPEREGQPPRQRCAPKERSESSDNGQHGNRIRGATTSVVQPRHPCGGGYPCSASLSRAAPTSFARRRSTERYGKAGSRLAASWWARARAGRLLRDRRPLGVKVFACPWVSPGSEVCERRGWRGEAVGAPRVLRRGMGHRARVAACAARASLKLRSRVIVGGGGIGRVRCATAHRHRLLGDVAIQVAAPGECERGQREQSDDGVQPAAHKELPAP